MQKEHNYYVYILTNYSKEVFYIGVTNDILRRIIEHKNGLGCEFTRKYKLRYLVHFEQTSDIYSAIGREKELKRWRREKKLSLINKNNPQLDDLSAKLFKDCGVSETEIKELVNELKRNYRESGR